MIDELMFEKRFVKYLLSLLQGSFLLRVYCGKCNVSFLGGFLSCWQIWLEVILITIFNRDTFTSKLLFIVFVKCLHFDLIRGLE